MVDTRVMAATPLKCLVKGTSIAPTKAAAAADKDHGRRQRPLSADRGLRPPTKAAAAGRHRDTAAASPRLLMIRARTPRPNGRGRSTLPPH